MEPGGGLAGEEFRLMRVTAWLKMHPRPYGTGVRVLAIAGIRKGVVYDECRRSRSPAPGLYHDILAERARAGRGVHRRHSGEPGADSHLDSGLELCDGTSLDRVPSGAGTGDALDADEADRIYVDFV